MITVNKKLFSEVASKLKTEEFYNLLHSKIEEGLKLYKGNPELLQLVSEFTGVPQDELRVIWSDVYRVVVDVFYKRVKVKKARSGGTRLNTLANSIYFALYEKYEHKTPELMYSILEPYMVRALQGDDPKAVETARLFFLPISSDNVDQILALLREVMESNKEYFCNDTVIQALDIVCSRSSSLPRSTGAGIGLKDTEYCIHNLKRIASEVCMT